MLPAMCLTDAELAALTLETAPAALQPAQQAHLLGCDSCRARLLAAFRTNARHTDAQSIEETLQGSDKDSLPEDVPASIDRYGMRTTDTGAVEVLGRGGYGKVLLARDLAVGRDVALKCLSSAVIASPKRLQSEARLLREARVMGQLEHPAIVPLYDVGRTAQGQLFYTMRRIRGRTLAEAVEAAPDFAARLRLLPHVLSACHAIAYAHSRGVIHRDLKPQNVMVDRFGQTAVIDWGLASTGGAEASESADTSDALRLVGSGESLSDGKGRLGTPAYMSPEQLTGVRGLIDEKSDVWGLGALLFEVLTGHSPRESGPITRPPPAVGTVVPACPGDLAALCDKALAESRDDRYPTAEALAADLDAWLHGREVTAHVYRPRELLRRFVGEHRIALTVGLVSIVTLLVFGVGAFLRVRDERNRAREFGLSLLADVLPRMSSLGDEHFLSRFTGRVQEWLDAAGSGADDATVGLAWLRLATHTEMLGNLQQANRFAGRCLAIARSLPAGRQRYALEQGCEGARIDSDPLPGADRAARIDALWRVPPSPEAADDLPTLEARQRVALRRFWHANAQADVATERVAVSDALKLARRWRQLDPENPLAMVAVVDALTLSSTDAVNARDRVGALNFSAAAVREARQLLVLTRSEQALSRLGDALLVDVGARRWFTPEDTAKNAAVEREARVVYEALITLQPTGPAVIGLMQLSLETAQLEALAPVLAQTDPETFEEEGRAQWLYAMVTVGRGSEVLLHQPWLEGAAMLDTWLAFSLAAVQAGDLAHAVTWARVAAERPAASVWPIDGLHRFALAREGPGAEAIRHLEASMAAAQKNVDEDGMHHAILDFAEELERLSK